MLTKCYETVTNLKNFFLSEPDRVKCNTEVIITLETTLTVP